MRGCARYFFLIFLATLAALIIVVAVVVLSNQGALSWLGGGVLRNQATIVLDSVQQMSVVTTTRYNFSSLVTSERDMPPLLRGLYGERQVLVAVGAITGGIDLSRMSEDDVQTVGSTITLHLPPPALLDCFLDESASYVAERDTGLFSSSAPDLEGQARQYAIQQFRQSAINGGILEEVQQQAMTALTEFVQLLNLPGIENVVVTTSPPEPDAPLPSSCL